MRLLFDQNLSPRLVTRLADVFPGSNHVYPLGLGTVSDAQVWEYARAHDYIIVSKDADFGELSTLRGFPPKVVWLRVGNCSTSRIETLLRSNADALALMETDPSVGIISLL